MEDDNIDMEYLVTLLRSADVPGRAVQVEPMKPLLKAPGTKVLEAVL
jgi:hypothetical protein